MAKHELTKKQFLILQLLFYFRFINSKQFQRLLSHKDHRRINAGLKDLVTKGYVNRCYAPRYGILTKPALFNLTDKGRNYIIKYYDFLSEFPLGRMRNDAIKSKSFKIRCQMVVDYFYILYKQQIKDAVDGLEVFTTRSYFNKRSKPAFIAAFYTPIYFSYVDNEFLLPLNPHAAYHNDDAKTKLTVVYALDAYLSKLMLSILFKKITELLNDEPYGFAELKKFTIIFICPNNQVLIYLRMRIRTFIEDYYSDVQVAFLLVTRNQIEKVVQGRQDTIKWITLKADEY